MPELRLQDQYHPQAKWLYYFSTFIIYLLLGSILHAILQGENSAFLICFNIVFDAEQKIYVVYVLNEAYKTIFVKLLNDREEREYSSSSCGVILRRKICDEFLSW